MGVVLQGSDVQTTVWLGLFIILFGALSVAMPRKVARHSRRRGLGSSFISDEPPGWEVTLVRVAGVVGILVGILLILSG